MQPDEPLAFFITWTAYGTHLQGDARGWRRRRKGDQQPQAQLVQWRRDRLKHDPVLLSQKHRAIVERACRQHCDHRNWQVWEVNPRSNHVHVVVTAPGCSGRTVRDQLKPNCTRALREHASIFRDRPVWTVGGDWDCINSKDDLEAVCLYVREAQDRMQNKGR